MQATAYSVRSCLAPAAAAPDAGVGHTNTKNLERIMTREEKIAVVESYIHGLGTGDFANVPFAEDVSYESPLTPKRTGQEAIAFLSALFPFMRGADVQQHIVEGEYVATVFHLRTPNGMTTVFDKFRVVDGQLKEINPYYDPSVLNEAVKLL
jgi:SnoaL-like domain